MLIHKFRKDEMLYFSIYSKVKRADTPESKLCACLLKWAQISPLFFMSCHSFRTVGGIFLFRAHFLGLLLVVHFGFK